MSRPGLARLEAALLALLLVALPLGTAPLEIATGGVVALALARLAEQRRWPDLDLVGPILLITLLWLAAALGRDEAPGPALRAALIPLWALILAPALPALAPSEAGRERALRVGLGAAALVGLGALIHSVYVGCQAGQPFWAKPERGLFSHHLTLGYALLPPLAVALARRAWLPAAGIAAGVLASASSGPALSLVVVAAGVTRIGPLRALVGGVITALGAVFALRQDPELLERALLWTSGAELALREPLGSGAAGFREAITPIQAALAPDFYFPLHAHDAALQAAAVAGLAAWVPWAWLLISLWRRGEPAGRAAIAALLVGGLTQDTLGDLEVVRALTAWALLSAPTGTRDAR